MSFSRVRTLVTGGSGFIGSHLCERLLADGHEVLCVDNYYTGRRQNIEHLLANPRFEVMRHDITHEPSMSRSTKSTIWPARHRRFIINSIRCRRSKPACMARSTCWASPSGSKPRSSRPRPAKSTAIRTSIPQPESYWGHVNPLGPRACYDEGKRAAETLFFDYHRQHGVRIKVARIFNTYGPRMHPDDGRVVSNFIMQALRGEPITIYGDGSQTRSFGYVDDLIEGILRLMATDDGFLGPVNLGNPERSQRARRSRSSSSR